MSVTYPGPYVITLGYEPPVGNKYMFSTSSSIEDKTGSGGPAPAGGTGGSTKASPPPSPSPSPPPGSEKPVITQVVQEKNSTDATVYWKKPVNPSGPITEFIVTATPATGTAPAPIKVPYTTLIMSRVYSYKFKNLTPGDVTFQVQAVYKTGPPADSPTEVIQIVAISPPPPGSEKPVIKVTPGIESATVSWKPPVKPLGPIQKYIVTATPATTTPAPPPVIVDATTFRSGISGYYHEFKNLPVENVTFGVQVVYKTGPPADSDPVSMDIVAPPVGSDKPVITNVTGGKGGAVTVYWKKPVRPLGPIVNYVVKSNQAGLASITVPPTTIMNTMGYSQVIGRLTSGTNPIFTVDVVYQGGRTESSDPSTGAITMAGGGRYATRKRRRTSAKPV